MNFVVGLEVVAFLDTGGKGLTLEIGGMEGTERRGSGALRGIAAKGGDIDHAVAEFNEGSAKFY